MYQISNVKTITELHKVLELCYSVLGEHLENADNYRREDFEKRLEDKREILLYAHDNGKVIAAVLGREENDDSMIIGFTACDEKFRGQGITRNIIESFTVRAAAYGYKYITLGAADDAVSFYEKCRFKQIGKTHGQCIYQMML